MVDRTSPIKLTIEGLEIDSDWPTLRAYLRSQARFNQLCADAVKFGKHGIAIRLRFSEPQIITFEWRDYLVEATGALGELFIVCKKKASPGR